MIRQLRAVAASAERAANAMRPLADAFAAFRSIKKA